MNDNGATYQKPWVQRHWVLSLVLTLGVFGLLVVGLSAMSVYSMMSSMKKSPVYEQALRAARANPELTDALGQPIEDAPYVLGGANQQPEGEGEAFFVIPVHGPKGKATVHVEAHRQDGEWVFKTLRAQLENHRDYIELQ